MSAGEPSHKILPSVFGAAPFMDLSTLLIEDSPLIVSPKLASLVGLNEALVLQQVHFLLRMKHSGRVIGGEKWIWNTFEDWRKDHFPFWCLRTLKSIFLSLERRGLLISCQPDGRMSRKKYYRLDREAISRSCNSCTIGSAEVAPSDRARFAPSVTETTTESSVTEKSKGSKETSFPSEADAVISFPAQWKPSSRRRASKDELLTKIQPPTDYPSEDEFERYLTNSDLCHIQSSRDLYRDLCLRKWHHWNPKPRRWTPIRNWKTYCEALETKMANAFN